MRKTNTIKLASIPTYIISHNNNKHIDEKITAIKYLPYMATETLELTKQFYPDIFDAKYHYLNEDVGKPKSVSPTIFADDPEMNLISSISSGISLDEFTLSMIKWPGLDDSNCSYDQKYHENKFYFDGLDSDYRSSSYDNWSNCSNAKSLLLDEPTSFGDGNVSPFSDTNMSNVIPIINDSPQDPSRHIISNSDFFDPAMFCSNNDSYVNSWTSNKLDGELETPSPKMSHEEIETDAQVSRIIESSFDLFNKGDCASGSFSPHLSQDDMHRCLQHVIQSLLDASLDIDIIPLYRKIFEKFTLDISKLDIPSVGSFLHEEGYCKPCVFANKKTKTCQNGPMCLFCHYIHKDVRQRVKSKRRKDPTRKLNGKATASNQLCNCDSATHKN